MAFSIGDSSVFQAEVSAILAAARQLNGIGITNSNIDFLSDSQAALKAIDNPITTSDLVRSAKYFLNELGSTNDVKLHWIEGHKGWKYNEIADTNANKGREQPEAPENIPAPSRQSIYSVVENLISKKWISHWEKVEGCRQSRYFITGPSKVRALLLLRQNRDALGRLVRFLTGHAFLKRQNMIVFHGINPPLGDVTCRFCEDSHMEETPHHLITECEMLCQWRAATLGGYVLDEFPQWEVQSLAKFLNHREIILAETDELG